MPPVSSVAGEVLAEQVLLKIDYLLMRWLLSLAVRGNPAKGAGLLVLRHENAVLHRNAGPIRYEACDRACLAALTRFIPRRRRAEVPVTPAALLARHRRLAARKYDTSACRGAGDPAGDARGRRRVRGGRDRGAGDRAARPAKAARLARSSWAALGRSRAARAAGADRAGPGPVGA
jgi:hypothetical protein